MQRTIGATAHACSLHGQTAHVVVEISNSTCKTVLKLCVKCLERNYDEEKQCADDW